MGSRPARPAGPPTGTRKGPAASGDSAAGPVKPGARDGDSACRPGAGVAGVTASAGARQGKGERLDAGSAAGAEPRYAYLIEEVTCEQATTGSERKSVVLVHTMEWGTKRRR